MSKLGTIVFVHGKGLLSKTIEYFDGEYSHCFINMNDDCILETQYFVNTRVIPNIYNHKECTIVDLDLTEGQQNKLLSTYFKYLEDKYDFKQIIGLLFNYLFKTGTNKTWNNPNRIICSELIVDILYYDIGYFNDSEYNYLKNATPNILYKALTQKLANKKVG